MQFSIRAEREIELESFSHLVTFKCTPYADYYFKSSEIETKAPEPPLASAGFIFVCVKYRSIKEAIKLKIAARLSRKKRHIRSILSERERHSHRWDPLPDLFPLAEKSIKCHLFNGVQSFA